MSSIRLRLLSWLVGPVLLVNLGAAALTYQLAWRPAELAFDQSLLDVARALAAGAAAAPVAGTAGPALASGDSDRIWFAVRDGRSQLLAGSPDLPAGGGAPGVRDALVHGEPVRIATLNEGNVHIAVARTVRARTHVREAIVRSLLSIELLASLALAGLVWFSVSNGLAPLARLRAGLDRRGSAELEPLAQEGLPGELAPLVDAFNNLLGRIADGARAQQEFQADVAHQLRTPLAGLKLQLEWLAARHGGDAETAASIALMRQANERLIRETNQLLSLARAEPSHFEPARLEALDLAALVGEAVQSFVDQAAARDIDLGFSLEPAPVRGDRFLLRDLIDNLVDNALRYTPQAGSVTVRTAAAADGAVLVVEDSGPGIAPADRARVFERHVRLNERIPGSGLGLAIVRDIARVHGASVVISDRAPAPGAVFTVRFPA